MFLDISSMTAYLLYAATYAANAKAHAYRAVRRIYWSQVLGAESIMFGGYLWQPPCSPQGWKK